MGGCYLEGGWYFSWIFLHRFFPRKPNVSRLVNEDWSLVWYQIEPAFMFLRESIIFTSNFYYCLFGTFFLILLMQLSNMKTFCFIKGDKLLQEKTYGVGAISKGRIQNKYFWTGTVQPQKEWKEVGLEPSNKLCTSYSSLFVSWL